MRIEYDLHEWIASKAEHDEVIPVPRAITLSEVQMFRIIMNDLRLPGGKQLNISGNVYFKRNELGDGGGFWYDQEGKPHVKVIGVQLLLREIKIVYSKSIESLKIYKRWSELGCYFPHW